MRRKEGGKGIGDTQMVLGDTEVLLAVRSPRAPLAHSPLRGLISRREREAPPPGGKESFGGPRARPFSKLHTHPPEEGMPYPKQHDSTLQMPVPVYKTASVGSRRVAGEYVELSAADLSPRRRGSQEPRPHPR